MRLPKLLLVAGMVLFALLLSSPVLFAQVPVGDATRLEFRHGLSDGIDRLVDLQADTIGDNAGNGLIDDDPDDSGWDWDIPSSQVFHTPDASPTNTYGITGLGIMRYIAEFPGEIPFEDWRRCEIAVFDVWEGMNADPTMNLASDVTYLVRMTIDGSTHNPTYAQEGRARYDARVAFHGGPAALAQYAADLRGSMGDHGLVPWELGWLTTAALNLDSYFPGQGYLAHAVLYATALKDDIYSPTGYFQIDQLGERYYTIGLAFTAKTMLLTDVDPVLMNDAYCRLGNIQKGNGAFPFNGYSGDNSYQATAYAIQAFYPISLFNPDALASMNAAATFLKRKQKPNGGWEYMPGRECTQVNAEILYALAPISKRGSKLGLVAGGPGDEEDAPAGHAYRNVSMIR